MATNPTNRDELGDWTAYLSVARGMDEHEIAEACLRLLRLVLAEHPEVADRVTPVPLRLVEGSEAGDA